MFGNLFFPPLYFSRLPINNVNVQSTEVDLLSQKVENDSTLATFGIELWNPNSWKHRLMYCN